MTFKQIGGNSQAEIGTYHDVTGNQTNINNIGTNVNINALDTSRGDGECKKELLEELRKKLDPRHMTHPGRRECLKNTRVGLIWRIRDWFESEEAPNVLLLLGGAGIGKSTVASTIARTYRDQLGSEQYFVRGKSNPESIFRTIAFDLASQDSKVAKAVKTEIDKPGMQIASPERSFEQLLYGPLHTVENSEKGEKSYVLVVIDALDECGNRESRAQYIRLIKEKLRTLPPRYRFLVTSRPESDVISSGELEGIRTIWVQGDPYIKNDVYLFLRDELGREGEIERSLGPEWEEYARTISRAANGLFIWAVTVVKLIKEKRGSMGKELKRIATTKALSGSLDSLYESVFENALYWDEEMRTDFSNVLSLIMFGKEPLSEKMISNLLSSEHGRAWSILNSLRSLIEFDPNRSDHPIQFHASLYDYLTSENVREKAWFIDEERQKDIIAHLCFDVMKKRLRFNICSLETSLKRNKDIPELRKRTAENIPWYLRYVCRNWALHLQEAVFTDELSRKLETFALNRLLFWFEILSLTYGEALHSHFMSVYSAWEKAQVSLNDAIDWLADNHPQLRIFIQDADNQFKTFLQPVLESTPHIYMSFLPLMQQNSVVAQHYMKQVKPGALVRVERIDERSPTARINDKNILYDISYSSDGKRIMSATSRGLHVWDAVTGVPLVNPVQEKWIRLSFVKFSANGERLVSRDVEHKIIVWDAACGKIIQEHFEGLSREVFFVTISPDGESIAAVLNTEVKVWKVRSSMMERGPLLWSTSDLSIYPSLFVRDKCWSPPSQRLVYSPDGKKIAINLLNNSLLVWDASNGKQLVTLQGHSDPPKSVDFSRDGSRIVSASEWEIIAWNAEIGQSVYCLINQGAHFVCFSPSGKEITSVYYGTFYLRNAASGETICSVCLPSIPLITYSPMSNSEAVEFATASKDGVIRIWSITEHPKQSTWYINRIGWLGTSYYDILIWIPEEFCRSLLFGPCVRTLNTCFSTKLHFSGYEGDRWTECFSFSDGEDITFEQPLLQSPPVLPLLPPPPVPESTVYSTAILRYPLYLSFAVIVASVSLLISHYYIIR